MKQRLKFVFIYFFINNMLHSFSKSYSKYIYKDKIKRKNYNVLTFFFRLKFVFLYYIISLNFNISKSVVR